MVSSTPAFASPISSTASSELILSFIGTEFVSTHTPITGEVDDQTMQDFIGTFGIYNGYTYTQNAAKLNNKVATSWSINTILTNITLSYVAQTPDIIDQLLSLKKYTATKDATTNVITVSTLNTPVFANANDLIYQAIQAGAVSDGCFDVADFGKWQVVNNNESGFITNSQAGALLAAYYVSADSTLATFKGYFSNNTPAFASVNTQTSTVDLKWTNYIKGTAALAKKDLATLVAVGATWQALLSNNTFVSTLTTNATLVANGLTITNVVNFIGSQTPTSNKYKTSAAPNLVTNAIVAALNGGNGSHSSLWTQMYALNALKYTALSVISDSTSRGVVVANSGSAADFDSIFANYIALQNLTKRLTRFATTKVAPSSILLVTGDTFDALYKELALGNNTTYTQISPLTATAPGPTDKYTLPTSANLQSDAIIEVVLELADDADNSTSFVFGKSTITRSDLFTTANAATYVPMIAANFSLVASSPNGAVNTIITRGVNSPYDLVYTSGDSPLDLTSSQQNQITNILANGDTAIVLALTISNTSNVNDETACVFLANLGVSYGVLDSLGSGAYSNNKEPVALLHKKYILDNNLPKIRDFIQFAVNNSASAKRVIDLFDDSLITKYIDVAIASGASPSTIAMTLSGTTGNQQISRLKNAMNDNEDPTVTEARAYYPLLRACAPTPADAIEGGFEVKASFESEVEPYFPINNASSYWMAAYTGISDIITYSNILEYHNLQHTLQHIIQLMQMD